MLPEPAIHRSSINCIIGVDLDNTLVSYDEVLDRVAAQEGLIPTGVHKNKKDIRDAIRQLPDGESQWRKLQAVVYGQRMDEAMLIDGVREFFDSCNRYRAKVYIVSHKTEFASAEGVTSNLHGAAMAWMERNKFFSANGFGLSPRDVYFESTRWKKVERIRCLRCTHFIDDLEETFLEDSFPAGVEKILYAPHVTPSPLQGAEVVLDWKEISDYFFGSRG